MWKASRRKKLPATPLSSEWQRLVARHCAFTQRLPAADRRELAGHIQVFLAEKNFEGCGGLTITEEMRVVIAAQACLLLLYRRKDYYPRLQTILVYPGSYVVPATRHVGGGIWEEGWQSRAGESWQTGAIVLAWEEICLVSRDSLQPNVVLHEFAHQLDYEDGGMAGGITDITYVLTAQGWLYLAAVMDLYSRKIVGLATSDSLATSLATAALQQALQRRRPAAGLLHHSDRGCQYAARSYRQLLQTRKIRPSMSAHGHCYDNAAMESFWSTRKTEWLHQHAFQNHQQAHSAIFDYIETFDNPKRLHSALGYRSPVDFERITCHD